MIFGRRAYQSRHNLETKKGFFRYPIFQKKYVYYLVLTMAGISLFFYIPTVYFVAQNYHSLTSLAYEVHPGLVRHLEREVHWIWMFALMSFIATIGVTFWISHSLTRRLIEPVVAIERHMRELVMGRWSVPDFESNYDEFRELTLTYEYLYRSLKSLTEEELKLLDNIIVDPRHREAWGTWLELVNMKRKRLGWSELTPGISSSSASVGSRRHAS